jgi:hypothetical protein
VVLGPISASQLDPLTAYLGNPIGHGVHCCRISIDRTALDRYMDSLRNHIPTELREEIEEESTVPRRLARARTRRGEILNDLSDLVRRLLLGTSLSSLKGILTPELQQYLRPVLDWMVFINDLAPIDWSLFDRYAFKDKERRTLTLPPLTLQLRRIGRSPHGVFDPSLPLAANQDAIHISSFGHRDALILEVTSVQEQSLERFLRFLSTLPEIGAVLRVISKRPLYSSRVVLEPYMPALSAWIQGSTAAERLPRYLIDYVEAAIRYYNQEEWRTSIVLSAIALETLLAEIYEHESRRQAPDVPLGALKDEITDLFMKAHKGPAFPAEVLEWIDKTNNARIAAVHRGSRQLSGKETLEALRGLLKVVLWYHGLC